MAIIVEVYIGRDFTIYYYKILYDQTNFPLWLIQKL